MWDQKLVNEEDLAPYMIRYEDRSLSSWARALYEQQQGAWPEFRRNHDSMKMTRTRQVWLGRSWAVCQYTPHRMVSVSARVDATSIENRPCFLCPENLHPQEKAITYSVDYFILCNVAPIFDFHLVIPRLAHVPQRIMTGLDAFITLARDLSPHFVVIYNGPRCGASAPDHLHFQAFPGENLPIESQIQGIGESEKHGLLNGREDILIYAPSGFLRPFVVLESNNPVSLSQWFVRALECLVDIEGTADEPMINLLMAYKAGRWQMILFPRSKHRPGRYYAEGEERLLISPGAVDMAGVLVIPREEDYRRVDAAILTEIYQEVTLSEGKFLAFVNRLAVK